MLVGIVDRAVARSQQLEGGAIVARHHLHEPRHRLVPRSEQALGDDGAGALEMLLDERPDERVVRRVELLEIDELVVAAPREAAVLVEDVGDPAAHPGREVPARAAEDDDMAAGHVLAAVVADALDDRVRARVPDGEPLAREAAEERLALRRAVEDGVADDHVLLGRERRARRRPDRDRAS